MPIYEYECLKCHRRTSVLTMRVSEKADPVCRHCGGREMRRLMSRFATPRGDDARLDRLADPSNLGDLDENDPKSVARVMKRMSREMGEELAGPEFDEALEEIEDEGAGGRDNSSGSDDDL